MVEVGTSPILYSPIGKLGAMISGIAYSNVQIPSPAGLLEYESGQVRVKVLHSDWLGSARYTTRPYGDQTIGSIEFAPFGETYQLHGTETTVDFTGQKQDSGQANLFDFPARKYSSIQGRWISPDPAGLVAMDLKNPQSLNRYAYVGNAPLSSLDPSGKEATPSGCIAGDLNVCFGRDDSINWFSAEYHGGMSLVDGMEVPTNFAMQLLEMGAATLCPGNNCGGFSNKYIGSNGKSYSYVASASGPVWINNSNGSEISDSAAAEVGLRAGLLPRGTLASYGEAFFAGFNTALHRLGRKRCSKLYGGQGAATMALTNYRIMDFPAGSTTIAQTFGQFNVQINATLYMGSKAPKVLGLGLSGGNFQAFVLLHELGHQLDFITAFKPDAGLPPLQMANNQKVVENCF
jgi:RHS repeat-associated protein